MEGYWNSEELVFTSLKYKPAYGWKQTLRRYKEGYPSKESMAEHIFDSLELEITSNTTATLKGKWELNRKDDVYDSDLFILLRSGHKPTQTKRYMSLSEYRNYTQFQIYLNLELKQYLFKMYNKLLIQLQVV